MAVIAKHYLNNNNKKNLTVLRRSVWPAAPIITITVDQQTKK